MLRWTAGCEVASSGGAPPTRVQVQAPLARRRPCLTTCTRQPGSSPRHSISRDVPKPRPWGRYLGDAAGLARAFRSRAQQWRGGTFSGCPGSRRSVQVLKRELCVPPPRGSAVALLERCEGRERRVEGHDSCVPRDFPSATAVSASSIRTLPLPSEGVSTRSTGMWVSGTECSGQE